MPLIPSMPGKPMCDSTTSGRVQIAQVIALGIDGPHDIAHRIDAIPHLCL